MEGNSNKEKDLPTRAMADRYLRSYKKWNDMLLSSRRCTFELGFDSSLDESVIQSELYSMRALIVSIEDSQQRMFLHLHYIKGMPVEKCTKILNISRRTAFRVKNKALDSVARLLKEKNIDF